MSAESENNRPNNINTDMSNQHPVEYDMKDAEDFKGGDNADVIVQEALDSNEGDITEEEERQVLRRIDWFLVSNLDDRCYGI